MYTPEDFDQFVLGYLNPTLQNFVAGNVTRFDERESGSDEDVTINTLSNTDGDVQTAFVNVSIYLKDIGVKNVAENKMDYKPNTPRFDAITRKIYEILNGNAGRYWRFGNLWIAGSSPLYANVDAGEHFRTIRVQVKAHLPVDDPVID